MPAMEQSGRYQAAVLWPKAGQDRYSEPLRGAAVELRVRWNTTRREVIDSAGNRISLDAEVVLDRLVTVGSLFWLGTLQEFNATGSADNGVEIMEVVSYEETFDDKGRASEKVAGLKRFRATLPASA